MNKQILLDYANLKIEAKKIQAQIEFIKPEVLKNILEIRGNTEDPVALSEFPGYSFTITKPKTWTYSDTVKFLEKKLEENKKREQADGTATFEEKPQLMFLPPKE